MKNFFPGTGSAIRRVVAKVQKFMITFLPFNQGFTIR